MISPANGIVDNNSQIIKNTEVVKTMAEEIANVTSEKDNQIDNTAVKEIATTNGDISISHTSASDKTVDKDTEVEGVTSLDGFEESEGNDLNLKLSEDEDELMDLENCSPIRTESYPTTPKSSVGIEIEGMEVDIDDNAGVNGNDSLENEVVEESKKNITTKSLHAAESAIISQELEDKLLDTADSSNNLKNINIESKKSDACTETNCKSSGICSCSNTCLVTDTFDTNIDKTAIEDESHESSTIISNTTDQENMEDNSINIKPSVSKNSSSKDDIGNVSITNENIENNKEISIDLNNVSDGLDEISDDSLLEESILDSTLNNTNEVSEQVEQEIKPEIAIDNDDVNSLLNKESIVEKTTSEFVESLKIEIGEDVCVTQAVANDEASFVLSEEVLLNDCSDKAATDINNDLLVALDNDIIMADNLDILNQDLSAKDCDKTFDLNLKVTDSSKSKEMGVIESNKDEAKSNSNAVILMDIEEGSAPSKSRSLEEESISKPQSETSGNSAKRPCTDTFKNSESAKKPKLTDERSSNFSTKLVSLDFLRSFKSQITKMTRTDLEQFTLAKIVEAINHKTHIGELRTQIEAQELLTEQLRSKVEQSRKQLKDLDFVHTSLEGQIIRVQKSGRFIPPPLITRSVGLQVSGHCTSKHLPDQGTRKKIVPESSDAPILEETTSPAPETSPPPPPKRIAGPASRTMPKPTSSPSSVSKTQVAKVPSSPPVTKSQVVAKKSVTTVSAVQQQVSQSSQVSNKQTVINKPTFSTKVIASAPILNKALGTSQTNNISRQSSQTDTAATKSVIDLTDEDERGTSRPNQVVRGRPSQQMTTNATPLQNLAYLLPSTNGQGGQQLIIATNASSSNQTTYLTRPPMFKTITGISSMAGTVMRPAVITSTVRNAGPRSVSTINRRLQHPAPLPYPVAQKSNSAWGKVPPKPSLKITKVDQGIVISWTMEHMTDEYEEIVSYQIYAYQETSAPPSSELWRKVGDVKAMPLPMACTLTQFLAGNRYHFAVRAVDVKSRVGHFSVPGNIMLVE